MLKPMNYSLWAIRIEIILKANGLWETIEPNEKTQADNRKDKTAIAFLYQALPEDQLLQIMNYKWKEIPFNLDLTNIKQQGVSSESLDGGITESMNQLGIKEDIHCKNSKLEEKMINMDTMKITATKVEITERNKDDLSGYKNDHRHYKKSDGGFNQKMDQEDLKTYTTAFVIGKEC
nr:zinc finger, CCHC-type [Tanacetum cinerariifolium]